MADTAVIFVGPSLPPPRPAHPGVHYREPAARGDLLVAAREGATVIGLIDGVFHQELAVTPREVREVARAGVRLFGGASMGALRACECPDAMSGVGEIYARFLRGELTDDDEVAVTFDPISQRTVAQPLIRVREVARSLAQTHPAARVALRDFVERVRRLPFTERIIADLDHLAAPLAAVGVTWDEVIAGFADPKTDLKAQDARLVIAAVVSAK